jgi:hypothetical protein
MFTPTLQAEKKRIDRRQLLKLAAASVLLISACTCKQEEPESERVLSELGSLLHEMADIDGRETLISIAERIESEGRYLVIEHRAFVSKFNTLLNDRDVSETQLGKLINAYAKRRATLRNKLLHLQEELHASLSPDEWAEVVRLLNRTGEALSGYTLPEA